MNGMNSEAIELLQKILERLGAIDSRLAEKFPTWAESQQIGETLGMQLASTSEGKKVLELLKTFKSDVGNK